MSHRLRPLRYLLVNDNDNDGGNDDDKSSGSDSDSSSDSDDSSDSSGNESDSKSQRNNDEQNEDNVNTMSVKSVPRGWHVEGTHQRIDWLYGGNQ